MTIKQVPRPRRHQLQLQATMMMMMMTWTWLPVLCGPSKVLPHVHLQLAAGNLQPATCSQQPATSSGCIRKCVRQSAASTTIRLVGMHASGVGNGVAGSRVSRSPAASSHLARAFDHCQHAGLLSVGAVIVFLRPRLFGTGPYLAKSIDSFRSASLPNGKFLQGSCDSTRLVPGAFPRDYLGHSSDMSDMP